jgi:hypothetical protein
MIQITAYLKDEEDLKIWKKVENKSAFLHNTLQGIHGNVQGSKPVRIDTVPEAEEAVKQLKQGKKVKDMHTCPNGHLVPEGSTKCMAKGCKYNG